MTTRFLKRSIFGIFILLSSFVCTSKGIGHQSLVAKAAFTRHNDVNPDCTFNGFKLYGKVQFVTSFPDIKIKFVESFPDIKVKIVESFPDDCGEWQIVTSFPDIKVQVVESFPDVTVKYVESFPGLP